MGSKRIAPPEIAQTIHIVREEKVILDADLARIYGVTAKRLNEAIKRNRSRFPADFCFQLTSGEWENLRSQIATSSYGGRRYRPWVFTEHGAVMAANVLKTDAAIQMSVFVVRAFIKMRQALTDTAILAAKLGRLEKEITTRLDSHEKAIVELMQQFFTIINPDSGENCPSEEKREIGFHVKDTAEGKGAKSKRAR
jgi:hypothetical protein